MLDQARQGYRNLIEKKKMIFEACKETYRIENTDWMRKTSAIQSIHQFMANEDLGSTAKPEDIARIKSSTVNGAQSLGTFNTSLEELYYFTNAWIIDGASDKHVCNSPYRSNFTKTRDTDRCTIKCGRSVYPVECYGTYTIMAKTQDGSKPVTLNDVALCLCFRTNSISAAKMNDRGLH